MKKVLLFPLSMLFCCMALAQPATSCDIPFDLLPSGHILVKATVSGRQGSFIFDTGAGITVFTKNFFDKLSQTTKEDGGYTGFRATGERLDIDLYHVHNIEFGNLKKASEEVSWLDVNLGGIDGIISLKLLENRPFTIDFNKKVITLESAGTLSAIQKTAKRIPVQLEQSREKALSIFAFFKVNDTLTLQFALDSGAGKDIFRMSTRYLAKLGVDTNDTLHVKKIEKRSEFNDGHVSVIYTTTLKKLAAVNAPSVSTADFPVQFVEGLIYDGIIWINWLGSCITFDLQHKMLLVRR